jgi:hypothetical protein
MGDDCDIRGKVRASTQTVSFPFVCHLCSPTDCVHVYTVQPMIVQHLTEKPCCCLWMEWIHCDSSRPLVRLFVAFPGVVTSTGVL